MSIWHHRIFQTIGTKLLVVILSTLMVGCAATFLVFDHFNQSYWQNQLQVRLQSFAVTQAAALVRPIWEFDTETLTNLVTSYRHIPEFSHAIVQDAQGHIIAESRADDQPQLAQSYEFTTDLNRERDSGSTQVGRLMVTFHDGLVRAELKRQRDISLVIMVLLFPLLVLVTLVSVERLVTRPLRVVTKAMNRLLEGATDVTVPPLTRSDEVGVLYQVIAAYGAKQREIQELEARAENERMQAEQAREQAAQFEQARRVAEEADRWKSSFLANMSHEIRTPMNAVIGLSQLALKTGMTPQQRDYLQKILGASTSLLGIINDILDFSKIESGHLSMEQIEFDLEKVLTDVGMTIAFKADEKGLELITGIDPQVPLRVVGDPLRLGQVLLNFASNAVKFTHHGQVELHAGLVEEDDTHVVLRFTVADTGIGMTDDQQSRLFKAFSQADISTTRRFGGTGLGLVISKRLVEMMQGVVGVTSAMDHGSTFWFTARFGKSQAPRALVSALPTLASLRVLVVDDNASARQVLMAHLHSFGCFPEEAASGRQALDKVAQEPPYDVMLLDWKMPELDGIDVARHLQKADGAGLIPKIIMVSAYDRDQVMGAAQDVDFSACLVKPVSASLLVDAIMAALGSRMDEHPVETSPMDSIPHWNGTPVLLVEDNELNQMVASEFLEQAGFVVTIAENGQEGVDAVARQSFAIVLMDVQMPVMDGHEATRQIRANPAFAHLPIIAMTANTIVGDQDRALAAGMNDYVPKPIDVEHLFRVLAKWVPPASAGPIL